MDPRMEKVIEDMGCFGIGLYWRLCERIECWGNGIYSRQQLIRELKGRRLNSRHIHAILDNYDLFITSEDGYVSLAPLCPGCMKNENKPNAAPALQKTKRVSSSKKEYLEKSTSPQPSVGHKPMSPQPSVEHEPMSPQPSVGHKPMSPQPSVEHEPMSLQPSVGHEPMALQPSVEHEPMSPQPSVGHEPMSPQPSVEHEPMSLQPSVGHESMALQPSVEHEPMSLQPSVQLPQRARVRRENKKRDNNYNNTPLPDWIFAFRKQTWFPCLVQLLDPDNTVWKEVVCMQSGYSMLLAQHWENAVREFVLHIVAYDTANQIHTPEEARYYFNSFVKLSTKSGQALKMCLGKLNEKALPAISGNNPYRYEEQTDGTRYSNGRPIPPTAPPRPSPSAVWNDSDDTWSDFYEH